MSWFSQWLHWNIAINLNRDNTLPAPHAFLCTLEQGDYLHEKESHHSCDTLLSSQIYADHRDHGQSYETTYPLLFFYCFVYLLSDFQIRVNHSFFNCNSSLQNKRFSICNSINIRPFISAEGLVLLYSIKVVISGSAKNFKNILLRLKMTHTC